MKRGGSRSGGGFTFRRKKSTLRLYSVDYPCHLEHASANRQNAIPFRRSSRSRHLSTWAMQPNMPPGFPQMPGQMPPGYAEQQQQQQQLLQQLQQQQLLQLQQQQHHQMQQQMQQQQQMPGVTLMLVNVPPNVRVGEQMVVMTPTGQQYMVVVPQGAGPGSQFQIAVPNQSIAVQNQAPAPAQMQMMQQKHAQELQQGQQQHAQGLAHGGQVHQQKLQHQQQQAHLKMLQSNKPLAKDD